MSADTFTLCEGVVYVEVEDGTSRLLDLGKRFYGLSCVATRMLKVTLDVGSNTATKLLAQEYGIPFEQIRDDLTTFLADLERKHLIRRTGSPCIVSWDYRFAIYAIIIPMLWVTRLVPIKPWKTWLLLGLAYMNCRLLGWAHTVKIWQYGCPKLAAPTTDPEAVMQAIDITVRSESASHPLPVECKERALTTWVLGRMTGVPVELVVGIHTFPLEGHCWCNYKGIVYSDDSERCAKFKPVWSCL